MAMCCQKNQARISRQSQLCKGVDVGVTGPTDTYKLNGNIARRKPGKQLIEYWDNGLPGFGLRVHPSGRRTWLVMFRQRGKQRRTSLGTSKQITAIEARRLARQKLAEVALDGLPTRKTGKNKAKRSLLIRDYAKRFWTDYARHWKPSTQARNRSGLDQHILPAFGDRRVDELVKADVLFWRDGYAERTGVFDRVMPILSVMMGYAEQLGLRPRGSNPCKGMPRFKRKPMERFLTPRELRGLQPRSMSPRATTRWRSLHSGCSSTPERGAGRSRTFAGNGSSPHA